MKNLLEETLKVLRDRGKDVGDVEFVTLKDSYTDFPAFIGLAGTINYDNGYGGAEIPMYLKIVGDGWWLERAEYDGSEWWEYKEIPVRPSTPQMKHIETL